jgi:hypothetical protein
LPIKAHALLMLVLWLILLLVLSGRILREMIVSI